MYLYPRSDSCHTLKFSLAHKLRLSALYSAIFFALPEQIKANDLLVKSQSTQNIRYNTSFLQGADSKLDLELLLASNRVIPGNYRVDIYSNQVFVGQRDLDFRLSSNTNQVAACLTLDVVQQLGVDMAKLETKGQMRRGAPDDCYELPSLIDKSTVSYDSSRLRLTITIPQVAMQRGRRGYVDPGLWDSGVTSGFVNYQINTSRNATDDATTISSNFGLRNGINIGTWRLRNESNFSSRTGQPNRFNSNRSYIQHDVTALKGQFSAGDIFSDSQVFNSMRYRGLMLSSDEGMRADSERGYAPIIRGIAETNATVEIRQDNYVLSSSAVPPGPFEISDIYPSGSNGDLRVIIIEADGRRRETIQPFSSLPIMVRKGQVKYSVSAGRYNSHSEELETPFFFSGTLAYGATSNMTGVLGLQTSEAFKAVSLGIGRNTGIGAISFDATHSSSRVQGQATNGDSLRVLYAKTFTGTDTNFTLAAYRYSTEGYRTMSEHIEERSIGNPRRGNSKTRTDLTISQSIGRNQQFGNLYLNATDQRYWGRGGTQSISTGYSNSWRDLSFNLGVTRTKDIRSNGPSNNDTQINLSMSFPLGSTPRAPRVFAAVNTERAGNSTQLGVNGYLSESNDGYYSVQAGDSSTSGSTGSASLNTRNSIIDANFGYSQGRGYNSQNLNLSGSVVAHAGGLNLGQSLGETFALAEVPGAPAGLKIASYNDAQTGSNGFAVIPNVQPYRVNWISLDTRDLGANIEIENATKQVVPRRGSSVLIRYLAETGRRVQFELLDKAQNRMPFGAVLEDATGKQIAISDPNGKALAMVHESDATITIKWADQQCQAHYSLPDQDSSRNYERITLSCLP